MTSHLETVSGGRVAGRVRGVEDLLPGQEALARAGSEVVVAGRGASMRILGGSRETCVVERIRFRWMRRGRPMLPMRRCGRARRPARSAPPRFELVSMTLRFMRRSCGHDLATAAAEIGAVPSRPSLPDHLDQFLAVPDRRPVRRTRRAQPWLGRAIVLDGAEAGRRDHRDRSGSTVRRTRTAGSRSATASSRPTGGRGVATRGRPGRMFDWAAREHGVTRFRASISARQRASRRRCCRSSASARSGSPDGRHRRRGARLRARPTGRRG